MKPIRMFAAALAALVVGVTPARGAEPEVSIGQVDAIVQALGLKEILRGAITEQDIDTLNVFIKDTIAGKPAKLPDDLLKRLDAASDKLQQRIGPILDLVLNIAAEKAKQALRESTKEQNVPDSAGPPAARRGDPI